MEKIVVWPIQLADKHRITQVAGSCVMHKRDRFLDNITGMHLSYLVLTYTAVELVVSEHV